MTKGKTQVGYIYLKTSVEECSKWGGMGICDHCNQASSEGYLVPVLNHWLCPDCFNSWAKRATYYPEDIDYESRTTAYYERILGIT